MWWAMWSEGEGVRVGGVLWGWGTGGLQMQMALQLQVRLRQHMHLPAVAGLCFCPYSSVEASRSHSCIDDPPRSETKRSDAPCCCQAMQQCDPKSRVSGSNKRCAGSRLRMSGGR